MDKREEVSAYGRFKLTLDFCQLWQLNGFVLRTPICSFIGFYEVAQETGVKFVHQNSLTVQFNTSPAQSRARNLKMANCDCTIFPPSPPPPLLLLLLLFQATFTSCSHAAGEFIYSLKIDN